MLFSPFLYAQDGGSVTGTVTNKTINKPATSDSVSLISFGQGMQVSATTKTDAHGHYTLPLPAGGGMHLVRVDHQKASYFAPAPPGTSTANVDIYDVAAQVPGVSTEADVIRIQSNPGGNLDITEDFFVRNDSHPARTQFSDHAYEFTLPPGAKIQSSAARGPQGMPVESSPVPQAEADHYAFVFPVRPGETRFQLAYTLPYPGQSLTWNHQQPSATENLVVLTPSSMQFDSPGTDWHPVNAAPNVQTLVHKNVPANTAISFKISGEGQLPRDMGNGAPNDAGPTSQGMATDTRPGGGLGPPIDTPDPLHKYKGWILASLGVLLLGSAAWLTGGRRKESAPGPIFDEEPTPAPSPVKGAVASSHPPTTGASSADLLLGHALLALETDRDAGRVDTEQYATAYAAIEEARRRLRPRDV